MTGAVAAQVVATRHVHRGTGRVDREGHAAGQRRQRERNRLVAVIADADALAKVDVSLGAGLDTIVAFAHQVDVTKPEGETTLHFDGGRGGGCLKADALGREDEP